MTRMKPWQTGAALLVAGILIATAILLFMQSEPSPEADSSKPAPEVSLSQAPTAPASDTPTKIEPVAFAPPAADRVIDAQLRDQVSGNVISDVGVRIRGSETEATRTSHLGAFQVNIPGAIDPKEPPSWFLTLPVHMGSEVFEVTWPDSFEPTDDAYIVTVAAYAAILLKLPLQPVDEWRHASVSAIHLPLVPDDKRLESKRIEHLTRMRTQIPGVFPFELMREGLIPEVIHGHAKQIDEDSAWRILVPKDGDVVVQVTLPELQRSTQIRSVVRGETQVLEAHLKSLPIVEGRLTLDGKPVAGQAVRFSVTSRFAAGEPSPQSSGDFYTWSSWSKRNESGSWISGFSHVVTDSDGRFSFQPPFTHRVALTAFLPSADRGVWRWELPERDTPLKAELEAKTDTKPRRMRMVDARQQPLPHESLLPRINEDLYGIQYPGIKSDGEGWVEIRYLDEGQEYHCSTDIGRIIFVARDGGTITVKPVGRTITVEPGR